MSKGKLVDRLCEDAENTCMLIHVLRTSRSTTSLCGLKKHQLYLYTDQEDRLEVEDDWNALAKYRCPKCEELLKKELSDA